MKTTDQRQGESDMLFPSIRLVSLGVRRRTETPLSCIPDPLPLRCIPDPPVPPICIPDPPIRSSACVGHFRICPGVLCTCDCAGHCACDTACSCDFYVKPPCNCDPLHSCYCVSKKGLSPDTQLPPEGCGAHARTFFRLAKEES